MTSCSVSRRPKTPGAAIQSLPVSVVVLTKNEQTNIGRCLASLGWCDDVLVVDDHSDDDTRQIAAGCGARVVEHRFESFAQQRNWALDHGGLNYPWVLMLDADEILTEPFSQALAAALHGADRQVAGFRICRKTMFLGRWLKYSDGFPVWITRVVRLGRARFVDHGHGEQAVLEGPGHFATLDAPLLHYPFSKGIADWVARHNRYSTREAELEAEAAGHFRWSALLARDPFARRQALRQLSRKLPCRPVLRFFHQYLFKRGILEGRAGLAFCFLMAVYEGLIVVKRWEGGAEQE